MKHVEWLTTNFQDSIASAELNALGVYLLWSLVFVVFALLEFAFVVMLSRAPSVSKKNFHGSATEKRTHFIAERLHQRKIANKASSAVDRREKGDQQLKDRKWMKVISKMPPIHIVDLVSFCLYIFLFISFNTFYWMNYQMFKK